MHSPQTRKSCPVPSDSQANTPSPVSEQGMIPSLTTEDGERSKHRAPRPVAAPAAKDQESVNLNLQTKLGGRYNAVAAEATEAANLGATNRTATARRLRAPLSRRDRATTGTGRAAHRPHQPEREIKVRFGRRQDVVMLWVMALPGLAAMVRCR